MDELDVAINVFSHLSELIEFKENVQNPSTSSVMERGMNDELYDKLAQALIEADSCRRDAFEESIRRWKSEKDAIEAKRRVKTYENLNAEELRRRRNQGKT